MCVCFKCVPVLYKPFLCNSFAGIVVQLVHVSVSFVLVFYFF